MKQADTQVLFVGDGGRHYGTVRYKFSATHRHDDDIRISVPIYFRPCYLERATRNINKVVKLLDMRAFPGMFLIC